MALKCGHCKSADAYPLADGHFCPNCGGVTKADGTPVDKGESSEVVVSGRPKVQDGSGDEFTTTSSVSFSR